MAERFGVSPAELTAHAGHVEAIAAEVTAASSARVSGDAYGKLCVMVPVMLGALQDVLTDGIADAAADLRASGAALRRTATAYANADDLSRDQLDRIRDQL